jgi:peptidoglycan glycosyltransferase
VPIAREINRLLLGLLVLFGIVTIAAAYWGIVGADTIAEREDNPRRVEAEAAILRGAILDRNGVVLAQTRVDDAGVTVREYLVPSTFSALGYYSLRYGEGGVEAAFNSALRGDDLVQASGSALFDRLLHRPQRGADLQLTLDARVQEVLASAMEGQTGAAVVIGVPDGDVLALVSLPTYDPNTLDANWDGWVSAAGNPFFNRALLGLYQPGATLQTPLIAAAMLFDQPLDSTSETATQAVNVGGVEIDCAVRLPEMPLTLSDAYAFACPAPFAALVDALGTDVIEASFDTFRLGNLPALEGFDTLPPAPNSTPAPSETTVRLTADNLLENALGQGQLRVTPLHMALIGAAVVNDGNAPPPYLLSRTRAPGSDAWTEVWSARPSIPLATTNTARRLQDLMRAAVATGAAQNAGRPSIDIGGHAALAYSGDGSLAWFVGFATFGGQRGAAIAVVLENSRDPGLAADIGGTALAAAQAALAGEDE